METLVKPWSCSQQRDIFVNHSMLHLWRKWCMLLHMWQGSLQHLTCFALAIPILIELSMAAMMYCCSDTTVNCIWRKIIQMHLNHFNVISISTKNSRRFGLHYNLEQSRLLTSTSSSFNKKVMIEEQQLAIGRSTKRWGIGTLRSFCGGVNGKFV